MPVIDIPSLGGYSSSEIINLARDLTEKKGNFTAGLGLEGMYINVLNEFCLEARWHWRKKSVRFVADGSIDYDLTDPAVVGADNQAVFFHKFTKAGVKIYQATQQFNVAEPIFEEEMQDDLLEFGEDNSAGIPCGYFLVAGTVCTIHFDRPAQAGLVVRPQYWAMPNLSLSNIPATVPLVPGYLHTILVKGMVRKIYAVLAAQGSANYATAKKDADADYLYYVSKAKGGRDWADGKITEYRDQSEDTAIQSTHQ